MVGFETLGQNGRAVADVGTVLAEATVLYVGYGALTAALREKVERALGGE
ncbi:DUF7512 family protein [Halorussus caseinilyticus]|uniref:Uncharacterized protein n=1 Tax=Halorussus caseinilyticus TaxID=3034025 RepID=A0ABD5WRP5_9EURY|nr:hypothetical protein [Halorussus sp. DT72]